MSKIRSLLILLGLCTVVGIGAYATRGSATTVDGPNLSVREDILGSHESP